MASAAARRLGNDHLRRQGLPPLAVVLLIEFLIFATAVACQIYSGFITFAIVFALVALVNRFIVIKWRMHRSYMELPLIQLHEAFISPLERLPTSGNQMEAVCLYWIQVQVKRRIKVTSLLVQDGMMI